MKIFFFDSMAATSLYGLRVTRDARFDRSDTGLDRKCILAQWAATGKSLFPGSAMTMEKYSINPIYSFIGIGVSLTG
jgi:hypothetical protein